MAKMKIKKGDTVQVLAGKDKGSTGKVIAVYRESERVLVEGVNRVKKHVKPNPVKGVVGGVIDKDMPLHVSNVSLYNPATKKADRVGFKLLEDGKKVRVFKSNCEVVGA